MEDAGFRHIKAIDKTTEYVELLQADLDAFKHRKPEILSNYNEADFFNICEVWEEKMKHCIAGDQPWGYFKATKLFC